MPQVYTFLEEFHGLKHLEEQVGLAWGNMCNNIRQPPQIVICSIRNRRKILMDKFIESLDKKMKRTVSPERVSKTEMPLKHYESSVRAVFPWILITVLL